MSIDIYNIFVEIQNKQSYTNGTFTVERLPFSSEHKLGVSEDGYPMFFVKCSDTHSNVDLNLEMISILFNRNCRIYELDKSSKDVFTMIVLKSQNSDLQRYFIDIVCILINQLQGTPSSKALLVEIDKMVELFKRSNNISISILRGLWAELFVIDKSSNPEYMLAAWHSNTEAKFDFNDGKDKLEVKSTSKSIRVHTFSVEQLNPNVNSKLIIASLFVIQTGVGKSIIDLRNSILVRVKNLQLQLKLSEIIVKTIGCEFNKIEDLYFDYQLAIDTLKYYNGRDIPSISLSNIPPLVSNVHFDSNLDDISELDDMGVNCPLLNAARYE